MTGKNFVVRLGIEEVALAMSILGHPDVAKALFITTFGDLSPDDEEGRLLAAGHSLMARGLLSVANGESKLDADFAKFMDILIGPTSILQFSLRSGEDEEALTYFFKGAARVEQRVDQGVVYNFRSIQNTSEIFESTRQLFGVTQAVTEPTEIHPEVKVPMSLLDKARDPSINTPGALTRMFEQANVPSTLSRMLAQDFLATRGRGTAMLVENRQGQLVSDHGFLVMKSAERTWLFPLFEQGEAYARVLLATHESFTQQTQLLISKIRN